MTKEARKTRSHAQGKAPARKKKSEARAQTKSIARQKDDGEIPSTSLVTMRELSRYLNVSRTTLWKLVQNGQVPHYRVGHQYRFDVVAVQAAMARFT